MNQEPGRINVGGIIAALSTPLFLGVAPIFGKMAVQHADPFTVAALRTMFAVSLLWVVYLIIARRYVFIYPAGLMGCVVIGVINGVGSLFYYGGLAQLDNASLVQLINGTYLIFALIIATASGQPLNRRTVLRVMIALFAMILIFSQNEGGVEWLGVGLMFGSALMFAGTVTLSQYVLYEMPAPTAALYILTTMGVIVMMVWLALSPPLSAAIVQAAGVPILLLGLTTALSRLAMFAGVKFLGGMQTAIFAVLEMAVAVVLGFIVFGESLTPMQWVGVAAFFLTILLIRQEDLLAHGFNPNALVVANMSSVQFQRIAFHRAFGTQEHDNSEGTMESLTTQELMAIQRMMGARVGGLDPYPIGMTKQIIGQGLPDAEPGETSPASKPRPDTDPFKPTRPAARPPSVRKDERNEFPPLEDII
jgi:drug/metabolite transporter (DMT)-like permease